MSQCKKFSPNIFHKSKCSNCFKQKEEHSAEALESIRASRSIARSGYLFVAPDWDFSVPLNRTKRWQRRWFVLYDDGELNYSVDEHPDTIPQGSVDMSKVLEVTGAEQITGHPHSLALTSPDRVTFVKAASREDARWWAELLAVFPRRHKRNATFPGGRASPSLPQLGRSASPQPPRPRHLSISGPSPRTNFETPPLKEAKEERDSPPKEPSKAKSPSDRLDSPLARVPSISEETLIHHTPLSSYTRPNWVPERTPGVAIETPPSSLRKDYIISSGSPPTRDKLRCDDKARARRDWRNERLRDIATAMTDRSPESSLALPAEGLLHLKKGWLWMKAEPEWVRRWVVLCGPTLNVYTDQDEQVTPEVSVELSTVVNYTEVPTESKYGFEIQWAGPTLTLSAVTMGIRSNWLQALNKAAPMPLVDSPITPLTPKSLLLSSDEEYRTASEGGRRGSEDWSELPPSPPLTRLSLRVKDRVRLRPRLPRCQSRQSTLDSTSTDELDSAKDPIDTVELHNSINKSGELVCDLQRKLTKSAQEVSCLEEEISRLKRLQSEAAIREKKTKEVLTSLEQRERDLNQRNSQMEIKCIKEQKVLQRRLSEAEENSRTFEEKHNILCRELQAKQLMLSNLQDELASSNTRLEQSRLENDRLYKKLQELESKICFKSSTIRIDSLTDLTNIDLEVDLEEMGPNEVREYCLDLKCRFEKAIIEIRAIKRSLRSSEETCDRLEIANYSLKSSIEVLKQEHEAEVKLLVQRLDHLTMKLTSAEKQMRSKSKTEAKEKRRSLSLKGRESFSINKDVEDKVTELEAKIIALEKNKSRRKYKRDRSSERGSPRASPSIEDRTLRRLRRKSLDSATSSEPMKLLMRLSSLESKVTSVNASTESLNIFPAGSVSDLTKLTEESQNYEQVMESARTKVSECLHTLNSLKSKRMSIPSSDRLTSLENTLNELNVILSIDNLNVSTAEANVVNSSAEAVVKQLQTLLLEKLTSLAEKKRLLIQNGELDPKTRLEILAEKISFENILVNRIQEALNSPGNGEPICKRLIDKETKETAHLIMSLQNKLSGTCPNKPPSCRTSAEYLSTVLARCLISATQGVKGCKNFIASSGPSIDILLEEQKKLEVLLNEYKSVKLPKLAESLANESYNLSTDKACNLRSINEDIVNDFTNTATGIANTELIKSEINHVLLRAAQEYQEIVDSDHAAFFSFFASERAALELWSDSVNDCLVEEISKSIQQLTELYQNGLNKLKRQNWRRRVEQERTNYGANSFLQEFADIIAHKALIDARINVLSGKYNGQQFISESSEDTNLDNWLENEKCWMYLENESPVPLSQSLQSEFTMMLDRFSQDCFAVLHPPELDQVVHSLDKVTQIVKGLKRDGNIMDDDIEDDIQDVNGWQDVCKMCTKLRDDLEKVRGSLEKPGSLIRSTFLIDQRPAYLGTEYLTQVENLRAAYRCALASCTERHQESDIEQLRQLCEKVLGSMEQWHRRTIQELREAHAQEVDILKQEKEQALAEETQATLAALDAMRKAHVAEVQREVARFKQDFARQQRDEIMDLTERLSVKSLEAAALEEQLGSATRQLAHAQQHILRLERNPQLSVQN